MFLPEGQVPAGEELADLAVIQQETVIPKWKWTFSKAAHTSVVALYDGKVRQTDEEVGQILAKLEELGLNDRTLVAVTADHGEELFDHGFVGHASTSLAGTLYDEVIRVPLIMRLPGILPAGKVIEEQVEGIDVMPTIFALLRLPPLSGVQGSSLLSLVRGSQRGGREYAFSETLPCGRQCQEEDEEEKLRAIRTLEWKLIAYANPGGERYELYNLQDDPHERKDVFLQVPRVAAGLRQKLGQWQALSALRKTEIETERQRVEAEIRQGESSLSLSNSSVSSPVVLQPQAEEMLGYDQEDGRVRLAWAGNPATTYEIHYNVGVDEHHLEGVLTVAGTRKEFGPLTRAVWDLLPLYNPFRFRVRDTRCRQESCWSNWLSFQVGGG
jgi:hypothetical protein